MILLLVFKASGEVAGSFEGISPVDALIQFYQASGWPPWVWIDGERVRYEEGNQDHLKADLERNWATYCQEIARGAICE